MSASRPFIRRSFSILCFSILFLVVAYSVPGRAEDCFSGSPTKNSQRPITSEIQDRDITKAEYNDLKTLFQSLEGRWSGRVSETICRGSLNAVNKEIHNYTVEPTISFEHPETLFLESIWHSQKKRTSRIENLELILTKNRLRLGVDAPAGDIELIKVADNFLVILKKDNVRNPSGGVVTQEIVRSISHTGKSLTIEYLLYTNGLLSSFSLWELTR